MKKSRLAVILAALLLLPLPLTACKGGSADTDGTDTAEVVTIPPVTIPEKPDTRTYTDLTEYEEKLADLLDGIAAAPAADFTYTVAGDGVTGTGYTGGDTLVVIPDSFDGKPVTAIAEGAFADKTTIKSIAVPDTVTSIGKGAFRGCKGLTSLRTPVFTCEDAPYFGALFGAETYEANGYTVPTGLSWLVITGSLDNTPTAIPDTAFYACRGLKAISLPGSIYEIGSFAFYDCQSLAYIRISGLALEAVGRNAFANCTSLLTLEIPHSVQTLGFAMLEGCAKLESLTLPFVGGCRVGYVPPVGAETSAETVKPEETTYLGYLFGAADYTHTKGFIPASLISVTLTEGCGDIPANAFFECSPIREVNFPTGTLEMPRKLTSIGRRAFYGCEGVASVKLPDTVASVGDDAFSGCIRLTSFEGGAALSTLGVQVFMDCVSLATVTLPDTVTHLPNSCFAGCISLETLTASGVKTQGRQVFRHCNRLGLPWVNPECVPAETEG